MDKRIRLHTTPDNRDKFLTFNVKQTFDILDILSLTIRKEDLYRNFESNYGVLVGRVNINQGLGAPNVKVSIFIPITDEDKLRSDIYSLYPFENVTDTNSLGYRYNLFTPKKDYQLGTFPTKIEIVTDDSMSEVYKKYYKFTTVTNKAGDYMFFGVPVGAQTLHVDMDITDMGDKYSYSADELKNSGVPTQNLAIDSKGGYKPKSDSNLNSLPQIFTQNLTVDVRPLWGNINPDIVGITRCDVNFAITYSTYTTFLATMGFERLQYLEDKGKNFLFWKDHDFAEMFWYNNNKSGYSDESEYKPGMDIRVIPFIGDRYKGGSILGEVEVKVYMYDQDGNKSELFDFIKVESENINRDGLLLLKIPCYSHHVITNEYGEEVFSTDGRGIATAGTYHIEITINGASFLNGGKFNGYLIRNQFALKLNGDYDDSRCGFIMERDRFYTSSYRVVKNKREPFSYNTVKIKNNRGYVIDKLHREDYDIVANAPELKMQIYENDWINGFLYFGRLANGGSEINQSEPFDLEFNYGGIMYYKVETRVVDITKQINYFTNTDEVYHFFDNINDFEEGGITQPTKYAANVENNLLPKPLTEVPANSLDAWGTRHEYNNKYFFMTGMYLSGENKLKKYSNIILSK